MEMFLPRPTCRSPSPMPFDAPPEEAAEEVAEEAAEEEEGDHHPLQDHLKRHKVSTSLHHKEM